MSEQSALTPLWRGLVLVVLWASSGLADPLEEAARCDTAATRAAHEAHIPGNALRAAARLASGRRIGAALLPWPWTVRIDGEPIDFETEDELRHFLFAAFKSGARVFDVGCFAVRHRWPDPATRGLDDMVAPLAGARHAAGALRAHYHVAGTWTGALAALHARGHALAGPARPDSLTARRAIDPDGVYTRLRAPGSLGAPLGAARPLVE